MKEEFFIALGENKTLVTLNLNGTLHTSQPVLNLLGKACAMNHKKQGSLHYLSLTNAFPNYATFRSFLENFHVSDFDHETWYGDKKIAKDMTKEQLEKRFEFGLHHLNIGNSNLSGNGFKHKELVKRKEPLWPHFMKVFTAIDTLNLQFCQQLKNDMDLITHSLYENPVGKTVLRVLNLSRNAIMKEGAKTLASALESNDSLEVLDIS